MKVSELIDLLGAVVAALVIIEKVISDFKDWNGSPEIKLVRNAVNAFQIEMKSLNATIKQLIDRL